MPRHGASYQRDVRCYLPPDIAELPYRAFPATAWTRCGHGKPVDEQASACLAPTGYPQSPVRSLMRRFGEMPEHLESRSRSQSSESFQCPQSPNARSWKGDVASCAIIRPESMVVAIAYRVLVDTLAQSCSYSLTVDPSAHFIRLTHPANEILQPKRLFD